MVSRSPTSAATISPSFALLGSFHQNVVSAHDVILDHRFAAHLQRERVAFAGEIGEL